MAEIRNHKSSERFSIESVRAAPIPITNRVISAYVQEKISALKRCAYLQTVHENELTHEPLVNLNSCGIRSLSFEWEKHHQSDACRLNDSDSYLAKGVYVRKSVAARLVAVDSRLGSCGLHLYARSGYRHPKVQEMRFLYAKEKFGEDYAMSKFALKKDLIGPDSVFPHSTGGVVDVEIWQDKKRLRMGEKGVPTGIFDFELLFSKSPEHSDARHLVLEKKLPRDIKRSGIPDHWKEYRDNRRLLYQVMRNEDFYFIFDEFWHWGLGDHLSGMAAKLLGEDSYRPWYREAEFPGRE